MISNVPYETSEELLALARQHGHSVSPTQLTRWHRAGLLPRPRQLPLKEARGTRSLYPGGTGEQLLLLCTLRATERRLSALAWHLWLAGYPVAPRTIRIHLEQAALRLAQWMKWFDDFKQAIQLEDIAGEGLELLERYAQGDLRFQPLRRMRKRVGREHFSTFLRMLIELATEPGNETKLVCDEQERLFDLRILALGLGLEKRFVQKADALKYYLVQVLMPQLQWIFSQLQQVRWEQLVEGSTDFDLLQTRDELCTWLMSWEGASQYQHQLPDNYPRWQMNAQEGFRTLSIANQTLVLACWLALRCHTSS